MKVKFKMPFIELEIEGKNNFWINVFMSVIAFAIIDVIVYQIMLKFFGYIVNIFTLLGIICLQLISLIHSFFNRKKQQSKDEIIKENDEFRKQQQINLENTKKQEEKDKRIEIVKGLFREIE